MKSSGDPPHHRLRVASADSTCRQALRRARTEIRLSVQNLFDTCAPIVADPADMAYDCYGDPCRRRFEVQVAARF